MNPPTSGHEDDRPAAVARTPSRWLSTALVAVIAAGLLLAGGGLAVALGIGRTEPPRAGSVDAGFALDMSRHHLQAVEMANLAAARSGDPEVAQLAFDISETQLNQVGRMQGWLTLWGLPVTGGDTMAWMDHDDDTAHRMTMSGGLMPGMATTVELADLHSLRGPDFDVLFLQLMIRHHQGALEMAQVGASDASLAVVRGLAGSMAATQTAETSTMATMLEARGAVPLPAP